jgi:hypothetical protein
VSVPIFDSNTASTVNVSFEPRLVNPQDEGGDFHFLPGGYGTGARPIPDFDWMRAPRTPVAPSAPVEFLSNVIVSDYLGTLRLLPGTVGALFSPRPER